MIASSQFIVLDKRPYRESALIVSGLSPDFGKISFVIHGAQKLSAKDFPAADIFRELEIEFNDDGTQQELYTAKSVELLTVFDHLADNPKHFKMAGRIGAFLLKNSAANLPHPCTYDTLRSVLANLSGADCGHAPWTLEQCAVVIKSAFLCENGLLPECQSERQNDFIENLVASGIENAPLPECRSTYWTTLNNWLNSLIEFHHLKR